MEIQKTKGELLAFLESSGANSLIDFLGSSSSVNLAVADELDEIESSSSSSEVEETIEDGKEMGRDDEDFIILMEPKSKKKMEKRAIGIVKSNVPKSKRKCEFCGTMETPMWRRGPTGKGTLCNACGVKWSLKFRKRAGKKASKVEKIRDDGNQQRQSTRKKLPSKKSSEEPADSLADSTLNEDSNSHTHIGLCCNHSKKRKEREDVEDGQDWKKRSTRDANQEYDSLSDDASPQSNQLFGKLLNVVEVQLVEEEELERIKAQIRLLRQDLEGQEASKEKELIQIKADSLEQLLRLKGDMVGIHVGNVHEKLVKDCSDGINSFMKSFRIQMDEAKKSLTNSGCEAIQEGFARFESEAEQMAQTMAANFAQMSQKTSDDLLRIQTAFLNAEDSIKVKYATNHKDMKAIFTPLHDRMEIIEDPILKSY